MQTEFDKIYIISLITNKDRQEFIKYQMNELGLDFEFVYGVDFKSLTNDAINIPIIYPEMYDNGTCKEAGTYGCAITHYQAVLQAYEFEYNNVLIIEDDVCFIKNKNLIEEYLNNIPKDADFINFDPRFLLEEEHNNLIDEIKNNNDNYLKISDNYQKMCGGMMYGLMNRNTIKLYLDNQRKNLHTADRVLGLWKFPKVKRYISLKCICSDQFNISSNFDINMHVSYRNIYNEINKINIEDFYKPKEYHIFSREYN